FPDTPTAGKNGNYPLYAKLGALALVQATPTASGLHVAVHDVALQKVAGGREFVLSGSPNSREGRMSVHMVSDELESWITGGRGLSTPPTFAPDGGVIVYPHGEESGTDLFATTVFDRGPARRITVGRGSDNTSPTFSPDGRRLAFTSGRLGHPEVYISDADGT